MQKEYLREKEVAALYSLTEPWLRHKRQFGGDAPPHYKAGRNVLYKRSEIESWLAQRQINNNREDK